MKFNMLFISIMVTVCSLFCPEISGTLNQSSKADTGRFLAVTTYERVYEDGIWWIIIQSDGLKINQYPDPDQD